jgi:hypothetical protein
MTPTVSVWIPSHEHAPYLGAAIESVLAQTLPGVELVIVEDGSQDGSLEIATRYATAHPDQITVLTHAEHANRGVEDAARLAVSHTRGHFLLGLASDDMLYPDALERAAEELARSDALGFVYGYAHLVDKDGRRLRGRRLFGIDLTEGGRTLERLLQANTIPSMTAMLRRECFERAGGHDGSVVYSDWDLFARVAAHWEVGFIPRPLAMHRVHGRNTSMQPPDVNRVRATEVTAGLRERAPSVGGRLAEPRLRATLELQMAFLRLASGYEDEAARDARTAFAADRSLARDARWLADWLWSRSLDELMPAGRPAFAPWFVATVGPLLAPPTARELERAAVVAAHAERAGRLARQRQPGAALHAAVRVAFRSPRRAVDRNFLALLLDSAPASLPVRAWRRAKQGPRTQSPFARARSRSGGGTRRRRL